jgi:hypothetical protein
MIDPHIDRAWTCKEFEQALPELFERAQGGKLSADPRFAVILRDCPQAAELVRDLEYIAETARMLLEPEVEGPSSDVWSAIQSKLSSDPEEPIKPDGKVN